jgi:hypothetical protein
LITREDVSLLLDRLILSVVADRACFLRLGRSALCDVESFGRAHIEQLGIRDIRPFEDAYLLRDCIAGRKALLVPGGYDPDGVLANRCGQIPSIASTIGIPVIGGDAVIAAILIQNDMKSMPISRDVLPIVVDMVKEAFTSLG